MGQGIRDVGKYKGNTSSRAWQVTGATFYCIPSIMRSMTTDWQGGVDTLSFLLLCVDESRGKMSIREQCIALVSTQDDGSLDLGVSSGTEDS